MFFFIDKYEYIELKWFELIWTVLPFCVFVFWFQVPCRQGCTSAQGFLADRCPELRSSDWNDLMSDSLHFFASDLRSFQESAAGGLHGFGWNEWNKTVKMWLKVSRKKRTQHGNCLVKKKDAVNTSWNTSRLKTSKNVTKTLHQTHHGQTSKNVKMSWHSTYFTWHSTSMHSETPLGNVQTRCVDVFLCC